ncbi:MAG: DegT/DnrJ/EryC1/StrS family aminotransferase, partial [Syntrophales bacterium]|nr:DegT/DnrJ/EryC1/StrS family aminotransferase [Syntrophales bacterium]
MEEEKVMRVPFVDLVAQYKTIKEEVDQAIQDVIQDAAFIGGKYVKQFEDAFAAYCRTKYCIGVGNGTDALFIALSALGVGQGDEVITVANSFIATPEAITLAGARVVFVDCNEGTYNIDVEKITAAITPRTKAIIPVHLYGNPADMEGIRQIADGHGLFIVEDAAQAHGAEIDGRRTGTFGHAACFSFFPGKNLGAYGDGGAIVTNDDSLAVKCRMIANHGRVQKYDHEFEGMNSRLDGMQAAILSVKLGYLEGWTENRRRNAALYRSLLQDADVGLPLDRSHVRHVYHLFVVRVKQRTL